jgi:hypothetical protein
MRKLLISAAVLPLLLVAPALGSGQAKLQRCTASILNMTGKTLTLKRASSAPVWEPGFIPHPRPTFETNAAVYWWTVAGSHGCWNHVVYRSGRRVVALTLEGRAGHKRSARCSQKGFHRCAILRRSLRGAQVFLSVRLS